MLRYKSFVVLAISLLFTNILISQNTEVISNSLDAQFENLFKTSGNYQDFKVVKRVKLNALRVQVKDSINALQGQLLEVKQTLSTQTKAIANLKSELQTTQNNLAQTQTQKETMQLFGVQLSKSNYNLIMWLLIGILTVLLGWFIFKYKNANAVTKHAKIKLQELETEFENHRRIALEREQKVRRQLQDEINKNKA